MKDQIRHIVIDTSALASGFLPTTSDDPRARSIVATIFDAAVKAQWPSLRLYVPSICVAETHSVFDKQLFRTRAITASEYASARIRLADFVIEPRIMPLEQQARHVAAAGLVSPVNQTMKPRSGHYMGAADCIIAGMAILLAQQVGPDDVVLLTADGQMAQVMKRCGELPKEEAERLDLPRAAVDAGLSSWSRDLYPRCIDLLNARDEELRDAFFSWPLPRSACKVVFALSNEDEVALWALWLNAKRQFSIRGRETTPYHIVLEHLKARFASERGTYVSTEMIYRFLCNTQKKKAKRRQLDAASRGNSVGRSMQLFSQANSN